MQGLPSGYQCLNSSQPWFCFWTLHSLYLLGKEIDCEVENKVINKIASCQNKGGGYGGSPSDISHIISSFSAICSLVIVGTQKAYESIDRNTMIQWLLQMKNSDGSFTVHQGGEIDLRGSYCAIVVAFLLDILTPDLVENVADFVSRCQNYDGGFGPYPGVESHGSYSFCAIAVLDILNKTESIDLDSFTGYVTSRQMSLEGGFSGRINKLVDGCYSYWVGATFIILHRALGLPPTSDFLFDRMALQKYIILCCQKNNVGGLRDKPGKSPDYYHTCYCLSGLSLAQNGVVNLLSNSSQDLDSTATLGYKLFNNENLIFGSQKNAVPEINPVFNISPDKLNNWVKYFK
ncbi:hypothetical protein BB561_001045 [Smittium simulii]|uniref:Protein farnesyltransferase subunit beta n=1 Tax=Smittium simulii TaxID=133385 RepID=A0A2T9YWD7_9FUNG|nr:hypothetical protein BB561_001045 [Smittium simulii]